MRSSIQRERRSSLTIMSIESEVSRSSHLDKILKDIANAKTRKISVSCQMHILYRRLRSLISRAVATDLKICTVLRNKKLHSSNLFKRNIVNKFCCFNLSRHNSWFMTIVLMLHISFQSFYIVFFRLYAFTFVYISASTLTSLCWY